MEFFKNILSFFLRFNFIKINKKKITFISYPDLSDNSWHLFNYIHQNRNNLLLIWLLNENISKRKKNSIIEINKTNKLSFIKKNSLMGVYHFLSSRIVFFTHNTYFFSQKNIGPILVNLWHGMPIKKVGFYRHKKPVNFYFDFMISTSNLYQKVLSKAFNLKKRSIIQCGLPRNDILVNKKKIFFKQKNLKLVLWLPTFRNTSGFEKIHDSPKQHFLEEWPVNFISKLNEIATFNKILVLIKTHPLDVFKKSNKKYSNIIFLKNNDLIKMKLDMHELISNSDGLLSDVSSVIIDYILMEKPVGLTTNFLKDFKRGLIKELNFFSNLKYQNIRNLKDFEIFFKRVKKKQKMIIDPKNIFYSKNAINASIKITKYFNI